MHLHEYQAKQILKKKGIPIPDFGVASSVEEAVEVAKALNLDEAVVKIQVHAGGRGKAGGVKIAKDKSEIEQYAKALIGMKMVNRQTGPSGVVAKQVLITRPIDIQKEYYLAITIDRKLGKPIVIVSPNGGTDIEEIVESSPESILKVPIDVSGEMKGYQLLRLTKFLGWDGDIAKEGAMIIKALAKAFIDLDASLLEVNPLVETEDGKLSVLDLKLSVDENALFRHKELAACYDPTQISQEEKSAKEFDLSYVSMDGNIGCMVNGAGLAMATMDIIKIQGGEPANFLDVGGGASREKVAAGFRIILSDPNVKAVLVNIFGGIMNCETLAEGIIYAARELDIKVPIIIRMEGTNVEKGRKLLEETSITLHSAKDLNEAAKEAVRLAKG